MGRLRIIWAGLAALYAGFWIWHTPFGPPLTLSEVAAHLDDAAATDDVTGLERQAIEAFFRGDDGRPFYMLNLMKFRDEPYYPGGAQEGIETTEDANNAYGRGVMPLLLQRGSYPVISVTKITTFGNSMVPGAEDFDTGVIVRYRSRRDLLDMITSDAFQAIDHHKWASLQTTLIVPARLSGGVNLGFYVPLGLLIIGAMSTALVLRRDRTLPRFDP